MKQQAPIPVTVLTGFLGSGKTTLLNRILSENHGKRIAVIENEFGEISVDNELVIGADEEIFEMNNGCICCTVRGDLVRILNQLLKRKDRFDYVLIETTGLADPSPVVQTFFSDDELKEAFVLDGVVTLVDAKHVGLHIDDAHASECRDQIAFADVILLNKTDLVTEQELHALEHRIRTINKQVRIHKTQNASLPIDKIINIKAFDLDKIGVELDHDHHHEHHDHCDHEHCDHPHHHEHDHKHDHKHEHEHKHYHDEEVASVGIEMEGAMDLKKLDAWIGWLLQEKGISIYRMKGIFNIAGREERFVFQGVHMLFDARSDRKWKEGEKRWSRVVFIGKELDREELENGIRLCLVNQEAKV